MNGQAAESSDEGETITMMPRLYAFAGDAAAVLGILACMVAGLGRLAGYYHILGFEALTLLIGGIALMVAACLAKLQQLTRAAVRGGRSLKPVTTRHDWYSRPSVRTLAEDRPGQERPVDSEDARLSAIAARSSPKA